MKSNYPALGFDPAPGEPGAVNALADNFMTVARQLGSARDTLESIGNSDSVWQGDAATNFRGKVGQLPNYLNKANASLSDAATALDGWASDLTTMQYRAAGYEDQAQQALARLERARNDPNLKLAGQRFDSQQALQLAQRELAAAEQALNSAQQDLDAIRADARRLLDQHEDLARRVADALRRATDEAPPEPGFLESLGNALSGMLGAVESLAGKVWQWTKDHAQDIAKVGDILNKISAVLGVAALVCAPIEPLGAILGAAAGITSVAAFATQGLAKAAGANVSWTTLGLDAAGAIPFLGVAAKGAKIAQVGVDTATAVSRANEPVTGLGAAAVKGGKGMSLMRSGLHAVDGGVVGVAGKGLKSKLLAGGVSKFVNGQVVGVGGLNKVLKFGGKIPGMSGLVSHAIDPMSAMGRGIDIAIGSVKSTASISYDVFHGGGGSHPAPAGSTFSSRVAARSGS